MTEAKNEPRWLQLWNELTKESKKETQVVKGNDK